MDTPRSAPIRLPLVRVPEPGPCPYLPEQQAQFEFLLPQALAGPLYRQLMDHRFRRSGEMFYRPACPACSACIPIRVPLDRFEPSRSQRRVLRLNADVGVAVGPLTADEEHFGLYSRYQQAVHGKAGGGMSTFRDFLGASPVQTMELRLLLSGALVGVSVIDVFDDALSSVYFYYDPDLARRSLGVFSALCELREAQRQGLRYWYSGYYVAACAKMAYKSQFRPYELLEPDGAWRTPQD